MKIFTNFQVVFVLQKAEKLKGTYSKLPDFSVLRITTNYKCSIPVTQQFSDKLKINPECNKSVTFSRQSLCLDKKDWFKNICLKNYSVDGPPGTAKVTKTCSSWQKNPAVISLQNLDIFIIAFIFTGRREFRCKLFSVGYKVVTE